VQVAEISKTLAADFGPPIPPSGTATDPAGAGGGIASVWVVGEVEVALASSLAERRLRALWRTRQAKRAVPLLVVTDAPSGARVLGPRGDEPVRELAVEALVQALAEIRAKPRREAAASLAETLERRDRTSIPGIVIRGLLTKHVLTRRLRRYRPEDWAHLATAAEKVRANRPWRENLAALGYQTEELPDRGYVLRFEERPIAVVLPLPDPGAFSRATDEGALPEGLLISDCRREGVDWGLLASEGRFRLFPAKTPVGAATGRYLELDIAEADPDDWPYIGLLAPESLAPGGLLDRLLDESATLGNELRANVERQFRDAVLPAVARGLGEYVKGPKRGLNVANPDTRKLIEDAALLLLFRVLFFLYLESRGFLPLPSPSYRAHSATHLLGDARTQGDGFDARATTYWDRFTTLVRAMRTGSTSWGLPPYNGDLFAADVLEGAELLEEATLTDAWFGPALAALAFDPTGEDEDAGVDYGDLEIQHLGRIYEGLLSLRLSAADQSLVYDPRADRYVPARKEEPEVAEGELFYQTTSGGRKAAGVYYTPQVLVRHLVDHAVMPALEQHLARVAALAERQPKRAAEVLFDFRVLDPAMGSAHFLADALDRIAERIGTFLADRPLKPIITMLDELRAEARWEGRIEDGDLLRRLVVKHSLFGVDLSSMAVEVGKVSLWLGSFVPGLSLTYLGHNLRQGDSLVGVADPQVLSDLGPIFADHPAAPIPQALAKAREVAGRIAAGLDRTPEEVEASRDAEREMNEITDGLVRIFDVWCAERFGLAKARGWLTTGAADKVLAGESAQGEETYLHPAIDMAKERSFFHWPAEFPEVFIRERDGGFPTDLTRDVGKLFTEGATFGGQLGLHEADATPRAGFDVVIGNPPWEELTIEELAFYALHDPGLRGITSGGERRRRIHELNRRYPNLEHEFRRRQEELATRRAFFGPEGGYVAQGAGDKDTYKLFCERYGQLVRTGGWLGVVLPRSAFLVDGARSFRRWLFGRAEVQGLDFILNNRSWAFPIHPQYTIALLAAQRVPPHAESEIRLSGPSPSREEFVRESAGAGVTVRRGQLAEWTKTPESPGFEVPLLPRPETVPVFDKLRRGPSVAGGYEGVWSAFPVRELDETNDRSLFRHKKGVPVWKGRCFDQYDPHGDVPAGFAKRADTLERLQKKRTSNQSTFKGRFPAEYLADVRTHPFHAARVAFRDVSRATDSRTVRACLVPPETFLTNTAPYLAFDRGGPREQAFVLGVMNSLPFDWQARRFVETHMNFFVLSLLRFPKAEETDIDAIAERAARLSCVDDRFAEFAAAAGVSFGPLGHEESAEVLAELDGLVAKAYGLTAEDIEVVFSDFTDAAVPTGYRALVRQALPTGTT